MDWIGRNVYIVDSGRKQILACTLDGAMCTVLLDRRVVDRPRALALYPQQGFVQTMVDHNLAMLSKFLVFKLVRNGFDHREF